MKTTAAAILAMAATASADPYMNRFAAYMQIHNKVYEHDEFQTRFAIFKDNVDFVDNHDAAARGFTVELNEFADLTAEEFGRLYKGYNQKEREAAPEQYELQGVSIPTEQDWRQKGAVTAVKNQGQCGSCWSFSTTGSTEGAHFLAGNTLVGLSEQNLVDCSTAQGNMGCNGGLMDDAFKYIISNNGIDSEASYPYTATGPNTCQFNAANVAATISSYKDIPSGSEQALTEASATVGPVSVAIDASHSSFQFYSGGVYNEPQCSSQQLDHGVLVVGYGVDSGTNYYLVKNSWGPSWGLSGYIQMTRDGSNQCGIATSASYPIV